MSDPRTATALAETIWAMRPDVLAAVMAEIARTGRSDDPTPQAAVRMQRASGGAGAIAVIPLMGRITPRASFFSMLFGGGASLQQLRASLREAVADDQIGAIVLEVDSPGGSVDGVPEAAAEIRAARDRKPIVAVANTWSASAAYWLASQATELVVAPSGQVGSIGVFMAHEDWSKYDERIGVSTTLVSAGKYKVEGNPFEPLSDEAKAAIQSKVDGYYDMFVEAVAAGRGTSAKTVREGYGEGRMVMASEAVDLGMADAVGTIEDAVIRAAKLGAKARADVDPVPVQADVLDGVREVVREEVAAALAGGGAPDPSPDGEPAPDPVDVDLSKPHVRELVRDRLASSHP